MELIQEIKSRLRIEEFIGKYITLHNNGGSLKGLCPFHNEKTPSFHVNAKEQYYKCFGCQSGGDIIEFYQNYFRVDTKASVRELAVIAGIAPGQVINHVRPVKLTKPGSENHNIIDAMTEDEKIIYYETFGKKAEIFPESEAHRCAISDVQRARIHSNTLVFNELWHYSNKKGWGELALKYLHEQRKMPLEAIEDFKIFYIKDYNATSNHLKKVFKKNEEQLIKSGLFNDKMNLIFYAHRIIIPYQYKDEIVYLRGRYFNGTSSKAPDGSAKYLGLKNDPLGVNTPKRFFNINRIDRMLPGERLYIVEGEFDAVIMESVIRRNCIAIPGVGNINEHQFKKLEGFDVYVCVDNDDAGNSLLDNMKKIFFHMGKNITVKKLDNKDINDFVVKHG